VVATVITTVVVDNHMVVVANLDVWWKITAIATNKNLGEASTLWKFLYCIMLYSKIKLSDSITKQILVYKNVQPVSIFRPVCIFEIKKVKVYINIWEIHR